MSKSTCKGYIILTMSRHFRFLAVPEKNSVGVSGRELQSQYLWCISGDVWKKAFIDLYVRISLEECIFTDIHAYFLNEQLLHILSML